MCLMEAHIARAGHGSADNFFEGVCQAPLFEFLLFCPLCIDIQAQPCM